MNLYLKNMFPSLFGWRVVLTTLIFSLFFTYITAQAQQKQRPKIGVVLSGGGAKGLAHIGVLKELEKAGIPIDYIGGTSMGSIVGGLYAIGYTPRELDSITRSLNWEDVLSDKVSRHHLSMIEKDDGVKYMISFPIRENKIILPLGIVSGQNISALFSRLCSQATTQKDFSKFQVPFLCIAADVAKSQAIVLRNGDLAQAMRASMAIPTVFTPVEIDQRLLLDGGIINNFPVKEVKDMGADIIIGVDVAFDSVTLEMNSIIKIVTQTMMMSSRESNTKSRQMCNILILPDLKNYTAASFNHADSLVLAGEKAAQRLSPEIYKLAKMLRDSFGYEPQYRRHPDPLVDRFYVEKIDIYGLKDVPKEFLLRKMPFVLPSAVRIADIEKFIQNMYGTRFFERITYNIEPSGNNYNLRFDIIERNTNFFRVGLHYDNDYKATLLFNTTFRNMISKGSKISFDLALGENPSFSALYYKNSGWDPRNNLLFWSKLVPDYGFQFQFHNIEVYDYENDVRMASMGFTDFTADFFVQGNLSNNNLLGLLFRMDYTSINSRIAVADLYEKNSYFFNLGGFYKVDSYNEAFFPSKGAKLIAEAKYIKGISRNVDGNKGYFQASLRGSFVQPLSKRLSLAEGIYAGTMFADTTTSQNWFYMGGMGTNYYRGLMPFVGLDFMQRTGNHILITRLDMQWEMWGNNFLSIKSNIGKATRIQKKIFEPDDMVLGYGVSYGYRSPIGPMELTLMSSNKNPGLSVFVSVGYWF